VMRCLEKLPSDRFASADEVADRLEGYVRSRTSDKPSAIALRTLVVAGLVEGEAGTGRLQIEDKRHPLGGVLVGFAAIALVFAIGGAFLQWGARGARAAAQAGSKPLELVPASAGGLRVLATPWAEVAVDGQPIDVTPIAHPIPLAAGPHFVILTHPNALPEKRAITITAGETMTLDVAMKMGTSDADAGAKEVATGARPRRSQRHGEDGGE
jgi:hypothetical protein